MTDKEFDRLLKLLHEITLEHIPTNWQTTMQMSRDKNGSVIEAVLYIRDNDDCFFYGYYFGRMEEKRNKKHLRLLMNKLAVPSYISDSSLYGGVERALRALKSK